MIEGAVINGMEYMMAAPGEVLETLEKGAFSFIYEEVEMYGTMNRLYAPS